MLLCQLILLSVHFRYLTVSVVKLTVLSVNANYRPSHYFFYRFANIIYEIGAICLIMLQPVMHGGLSRDRSNVKALRGLAFPCVTL